MKLTAIHFIIIAAIVVLVYINWDAVSKNLNIGKILPGSDDESKTKGTIDSSVKLDCKLTLKKGSSGAEVQQLQTWMIMVDRNILPNGGNDGVMGDETVGALRKLTGYSSITLDQAVTAINAKFKQIGSSYQLSSIC